MSHQFTRRIAVAIALVVGSGTGLIPAAFAAENGGTQQGEMPVIETVAYTPAAKFNLTPNTAMTGQSFGTVNVQSNSNAGWTLEVKSLEGSALKHATLAATITYSLSVDGTSTPMGVNTYVSAKETSALTCAAAGGCTYNVTADIAATDSNGKPSGIYSDTITFKLTNK